MKRMQKAILLPIRKMAFRWEILRLAYWADTRLYELRSVCVMPGFYYRWLYHTSMRMVEYNNFRKIADRVIHTIPYHIRFEVA